jgi:hypothetical protein
MEVGRECGTHGRGMKTVQVFWFESPIEGDRLEDQSVDERMGSEWILGILSEGGVLDSTLSGHEPVRRVVNAVMTFPLSDITMFCPATFTVYFHDLGKMIKGT